MATNPRTAPAPSSARVALFSSAAGFMIGILAIVYRLAWIRHSWPGGHPWSALSITSMTLIAYGCAFRRVPARMGVAGDCIVAALGIAATVLWALASTSTFLEQ